MSDLKGAGAQVCAPEPEFKVALPEVERSGSAPQRCGGGGLRSAAGGGRGEPGVSASQVVPSKAFKKSADSRRAGKRWAEAWGLRPGL